MFSWFQILMTSLWMKLESPSAKRRKNDTSYTTTSRFPVSCRKKSLMIARTKHFFPKRSMGFFFPTEHFRKHKTFLVWTSTLTNLSSTTMITRKMRRTKRTRCGDMCNRQIVNLSAKDWTDSLIWTKKKTPPYLWQNVFVLPPVWRRRGWRRRSSSCAESQKSCRQTTKTRQEKYPRGNAQKDITSSPRPHKLRDATRREKWVCVVVCADSAAAMCENCCKQQVICRICCMTSCTRHTPRCVVCVNKWQWPLETVIL